MRDDSDERSLKNDYGIRVKKRRKDCQEFHHSRAANGTFGAGKMASPASKKEAGLVPAFLSFACDLSWAFMHAQGAHLALLDEVRGMGVKTNV